ncbi:uncharacterized protein [Typha angustifolia]|uniref:uncharacterized protein n=1 Tax=Typha angustifolia TaxID=59011 RepID=UPI003C2CB640
MWEIWRARNGRAFRGDRRSTTVVARLVVQLAEEYMREARGECSQNRVSRKARWEPPQAGWLKLNLDGAYDEKEYQGSVDYIIHNEKRRVVKVVAEPMNKVSLSFSEASVIVVGLCAAHR